jgi:hypothetical protein
VIELSDAEKTTETQSNVNIEVAAKKVSDLYLHGHT